MEPQELILQIKRALQEALSPDVIEAERIRLKSVELNLKTVVDKGAGFKFKIPFTDIEFGGGAAEARLHSIKVTLQPPHSTYAAEMLKIPLQEELVKGLERARMLIKELEDTEETPPDLKVTQSEIALEFTLTAEGKIELITSVNAKKAITHSVRLVLERR